MLGIDVAAPRLRRKPGALGRRVARGGFFVLNGSGDAGPCGMSSSRSKTRGDPWLIGCHDVRPAPHESTHVFLLRTLAQNRSDSVMLAVSWCLLAPCGNRSTTRQRAVASKATLMSSPRPHASFASMGMQLATQRYLQHGAGVGRHGR